MRLQHLDLFVTTDEPFWLGRSANFYRALVQQDFVHTYQMAHPGVLTMWAGALAYFLVFPEFAQDVTENLRHVYGIDAVLRDLGQDPMTMLMVARICKIGLQAIFLGISLGFLNRLFGRSIMLVSGAIIAFDPFLSGMDSLLHVDGLFAITSLAAVLALASAAASRPDEMVPWLIAGALAACAWMTRATGLAIIVVVASVMLAQVISRWRWDRHASLRVVLEGPVFAVMLWITGAGAVSLLLLPSLWVDPFGTMQQVWDWSSNAATEGHERPTFFMGEIHGSDPGLLFYPVTLAWRLTPVVTLGVVMFLVCLPMSLRQRWLCRDRLRSLAIGAGFALLYTGAMSVGAKKFDRYILPVYPIVAVFAAVGLVIFARWLCGKLPGRERLVLPALAVAFVIGQFVSLISAMPYRLDYFNPVLGGLAQAQHTVQLGWGEGGGEAMTFIVDDAGGEDVTVQMSSVTPVLSYFASPNIRFDDFGLDTPAGWYETDYFVVGIQEWQRDLSPSYHIMQRYAPAHVVAIDDVPFFNVYTPRKLEVPDALLERTGCSADFGEQVRLMQVIGRDGTIDLYWLGISDTSGSLEVQVTLVSPDGEPEPRAIEPLERTGNGTMTRVTIVDDRTDGAAPLHRYTLMIEVVDSETGQALPISTDAAQSEGDIFVTHSECYYD